MQIDEQTLKEVLFGLVYAAMRPLTPDQRTVFGEDLLELSAGPKTHNSPKSAELLSELAQAAEFASAQMKRETQ